MQTPSRSNPSDARFYAAWSVGQRALGAAALALLSPLCVVIAVAIKADSKGPVVFRQRRPGYLGREFSALKFRTMQTGAEAQTPLGVSNRDARITRVGAWLRKSKLDEIPQLWNIATGDMKLVGPRPLPRDLDAELRAKIPGFNERYTVRPGLTSLAQVCVSDNGIDNELIADWSKRFEAELGYIRHQSVSYDLIVILLTAVFVFRKVHSTCRSSSRPQKSWDAPTQSSTTALRPALSANGHGRHRAATSSSRQSAA